MTYIYTLEDPITNDIRYVGKTSRSIKIRYQEHLYDCKKGKAYSSRWINKLSKKGLEPIVREIDSCNNNGSELEKFYISKYKSIGCKLTNLTEGGEGLIGYKHSEECKKAQSSRMIGNKNCVGRVLSQEHKDKVSSIMKGRKVSSETIEKLKLAVTGQKRDESFKQKRRDYMKGRKTALGTKHTDKFKKDVSERFKGEKCHLTKLTESSVIQIKQMLSDGFRPKEIIKLFDNITIHNIYAIKNGHSWGHLNI